MALVRSRSLPMLMPLHGSTRTTHSQGMHLHARRPAQRTVTAVAGVFPYAGTWSLVQASRTAPAMLIATAAGPACQSPRHWHLCHHQRQRRPPLSWSHRVVCTHHHGCEVSPSQPPTATTQRRVTHASQSFRDETCDVCPNLPGAPDRWRRPRRPDAVAARRDPLKFFGSTAAAPFPSPKLRQAPHTYHQA